MGAYGTSQGGGAWGGAAPQPRGGLGGYPHLGNLPLRALVCDGATNVWSGKKRPNLCKLLKKSGKLREP